MKKIYTLVAAAVVLTACDNIEKMPENGIIPLTISASIDETVSSRAVNDHWDKEDEIGVTITVGELSENSYQPHINYRYVKSGDSDKFTGKQLYFYNKMTLSAYYPYSGEEGESRGLINYKTTADKQNATEQLKYDFLYGSKTKIKVADCEEDIVLQMGHRMSKLTFTFINASNDASNPMDVSKMRAYSIEGLKLQGSFNTLTGECGPDAEAENEILRIDMEPNTVKEKEPLTSLIVFPQVPEVREIIKSEDKTQPDIEGEIINKARLHMYLDEAGDGNVSNYQHYYCTLSFGDNMLKPGLHYDFTIYVTKVGMIMGEMKIVSWDEVKGAGAATIDGDINLPEE